MLARELLSTLRGAGDGERARYALAVAGDKAEIAEAMARPVVIMSKSVKFGWMKKRLQGILRIGTVLLRYFAGGRAAQRTAMVLCSRWHADKKYCV